VGVTVILALVLIERNLLRQITDNVPNEAPSFFFIDVQADQRDAFARLFADRRLPVELTPIVRSRLTAVDGKPVADLIAEKETPGRGDAWYLRREYVVTSRETLPAGNRIVSGVWWSDAPTAEPFVSLEQEAARHLGVDVGSTLTFDAGGRAVTAMVASLREVRWGDFSPNFFIIFSPGALAGLPVTYIATTRVEPAMETPLQRAVVAAFPNVTAINLRYVLDAISSILERMAAVVQLMAGVTAATGLLVLAGAVAASRYRRTREAVILKTLGGARSVVVRIFAVEYAALGAAAAVAGAALACLLSFVVLHFFLDLPWRFEPAVLLIGGLATVVLTVTVSFLATARVFNRPPLAVLRQE